MICENETKRKKIVEILFIDVSTTKICAPAHMIEKNLFNKSQSIPIWLEFHFQKKKYFINIDLAHENKWQTPSLEYRKQYGVTSEHSHHFQTRKKKIKIVGRALIFHRSQYTEYIK